MTGQTKISGLDIISPSGTEYIPVIVPDGLGGFTNGRAPFPTSGGFFGNETATADSTKDFDTFSMQWIGLGEFYAEATNAPSAGNASFEWSGYGTTNTDVTHRFSNGAGFPITELYGNKQMIHYGKISFGADIGLPFIIEVDGVTLGSRGIYARSSGLIAIQGRDDSNVGVGGQTDYGVALYGQATNTSAGYGLLTSGKVGLTNLPTSSAGLGAGDVWNNAGILTIV